MPAYYTHERAITRFSHILLSSDESQVGEDSVQWRLDAGVLAVLIALWVDLAGAALYPDATTWEEMAPS